MRIPELLVVVVVLVAAVSTVGVLANEQDCDWKYKCEEVLQQDPFICGRWAPEAEKICPPAADDVGSFSPFHVIKAPCNAPFATDRWGKCRLVFGGRLK